MIETPSIPIGDLCLSRFEKFAVRVGRRLVRYGDPEPSTDDLDARWAAAADDVRSRAGTAILKQKIRHAWTVGQTIDISGAVYGPADWTKFHDAPGPYYPFLAGFVRTHVCKRIVEIGTNFGGSATAMLRGMMDEGPEPLLVTIDIVDRNPDLHSIPRLKKLTGDANRPAIVKEAVLAVGAPIDLLYIDADHRFLPTLTNLGLYCLLLQPRYIIIDDILLNPEMRALWDILTVTFKSNAINCADVVPEIRSSNVGFGLIQT